MFTIVKFVRMARIYDGRVPADAAYQNHLVKSNDTTQQLTTRSLVLAGGISGDVLVNQGAGLANWEPIAAVLPPGSLNAFSGSTLSSAGVSGKVPSPPAGSVNTPLRGDGLWGYQSVLLLSPNIETGGVISARKLSGDAISYNITAANTSAVEDVDGVINIAVEVTAIGEITIYLRNRLGHAIASLFITSENTGTDRKSTLVPGALQTVQDATIQSTVVRQFNMSTGAMIATPSTAMSLLLYIFIDTTTDIILS